MAHALITGMTESGKSRLGITFCKEFRRKRQLTVVLDPMFDERWKTAADVVFSDLDQYIQFLWTHKGAFAFIDETGGFGKYNEAVERLICRGRHLGHALYVITQGVKQVAPIIRSQCRNFYLFAANQRDIEEISSECRQPQLLTVPPLNRGEFYKVSRFSEISKYSIDFRTGGVYRLGDIRVQPNPKP